VILGEPMAMLPHGNLFLGTSEIREDKNWGNSGRIEGALIDDRPWTATNTVLAQSVHRRSRG
jgi:hypothetical protein